MLCILILSFLLDVRKKSGLVTNKSKKEVNLASLEFSSEETSEENCCGLLRKLSTYKATWVIVTILVVVLCGALADPEWCHMSVECEEYHLKDLDWMTNYDQMTPEQKGFYDIFWFAHDFSTFL